jgi:WD40 repeat protein/serine/threonine protein kinase
MYDEIPEADRAVVESLCAKFRQGLQGDSESSIEQLLESAPVQLQPIVLRALLAEELMKSHSSGEVPPAERYIQRFPSQAALVNDVYKQVFSRTSETHLSTPADHGGDATMASAPDAEAPATRQPVDLTTPVSASAVDETLAPADSGNQPLGAPPESHDTMALLSSQSVVPAVEHGKAYRVESEIDRGGMGVVLKVHDVQLQRVLAMKLIIGQEDLSSSASSTPSADKLARFIREAEITGRLDHPGVVPVHEMARDEHDRLYFTMKFVQGKTLAKVLTELRKGKGNWTQARVLEILMRVCDTIAFAHSKGVIHRDLKPGNVMVGEFGETYVMDWGLAKLMNEAEPVNQTQLPASAAPHESISGTIVESGTMRGSAASSQSATVDGSVLGTPQFMSPEQATGQVSELDERADIYSIGALLYRVLTDCNPYHDYTSPSAVVKAVSAGPPTPISQLTSKAPAELVAIAEKAMQRNKQDRYATASAMADDLRAFLDNRVVGAYRTGTRAKFEKWVVRNRNILSTALLLLFGGITSIAYLQFKNSREVSAKNKLLNARGKELTQRGEELAKRKRELEIALAEQEKASQKEQAANDRLWGRKLIFDATRAMETSGATLASLLAIEAVERYNYVGEESQSALYRVADRLNEGLIFRGHQTEVTDVAFSPDGQRAVSVCKDGSGIVWDVQTGEELALLFCKSGWFDGVAFVMQGKRILAWSRAGIAQVFDADNGTRLRSWSFAHSPDSETSRSAITSVCLYPDRRRFAAANRQGEVFLVDCDQADVTAVLSADGTEDNRIESIRINPTGTRIAAGCQNGRVLLWNAETNQPISVDQAEDFENDVGSPIRSLSFNADGSLFVAVTIGDEARNGQTVSVWDAETGGRHAEISSGSAITAAVFHTSRKNLLLLGVQNSNDSAIEIWNVDQTEMVAESESLSSVIRDIQFAPDSDRFLTIADKGNMSAWDVVIEQADAPSIQYVDSFVGHSAELGINDATFNSDGSRIASASPDATVRIWDVDRKRPVPMLGRHGRPYSLRISPAGDRILILAPDWRSGHLWSYPEADHVAKLDLGSALSNWGFSPDGQLIFSGTKAGEFRVWDAKTGTLQHTIGDVGELYTFGFDASAQRLCLRARESTSIWNFADLSRQHEFNSEQRDLPILSTDGKAIFVHNFAQQTLKRIDPNTGELQLFDFASVMAGQFSSDQSLFWCKGPPVDFRGPTSRIVHVLESATGKLKYAFEDESGQSRRIKHAEFSRDGTKLLIEYYGNPDLGETKDAFSIRSLLDGKEICQFGEYTAHLVGAAKDFSRVILRSSRATWIYDGETGSTVRPLPPTFGSFSYADFSPDGRFFLLQETAEDGSDPNAERQARVSIREAPTGNLIANLPGNLQMHGILPDSQAIMTVSSDRQVRLWPINVLDNCESFVARPLTSAEQLDYLGQLAASSAVDQRQTEWGDFARRIRLLTPITPERRSAVWTELEQLRGWLGEHPAEEELAKAIESVQLWIAERYETDPNVLAQIASLYELQGNGAVAVKLLEQAVRHPRSTADQQRRLVEARKQMAPALASYASAAALAEQVALGINKQEFSASQQWADGNAPHLATYLQACRLYAAEQTQQAATLLTQLVAHKPLAPEPYLLLARCLRQLQQPGDAANVLRQTLDLKECRSPEVWKLWLQISFADLGKTPEDLLSRCPPPATRVSADEPFGNGVHWLLHQLQDSQPLRINSGGGDYLSPEDGQVWSQDRFFTHGYGFFENSGEAQMFAGPIANTDHPQLYQTERWFRQGRKDLPAGYQLPLPSGNYRVILGFAEIYAEDRSFDVLVEGESALRNYDPANGQWATADLATIDVEVTDGQLDIELRSNNGTNPKISTVQVISLHDPHIGN